MTKVLGIETSCDETAAAAVEDGTRILSNIVSSQIDIHARFGGVVPELASRAHVERILPVIARALDEGAQTLDEMDCIAVVHRPGLIGSVLVGLSAAKAIAWALSKPLVGVNHVDAHVYAGVMTAPEVSFPLVALVASGGHTTLCYARSPLDIERVGRTTDDAAGEAFDKAAALLGLPYPGGPSIEEAGREGDPKAIDFPRAEVGEYDFSFSGVKTACLYLLRGTKGGRTPIADRKEYRTADVAAAFQEAIVDVLVSRTVKLAAARDVRDVVIGGGVACNARLRERLSEELAGRGRRLIAPHPSLCTDNAAMVAGLGFELFRAGRVSSLDLDGYARDVSPQSRKCTSTARTTD